MKKTLCIMLVILSVAGSAFAAALATNTPTPTAGATIRGGADATAAAAAPTPLIKFSTGVFGMVNYTADTATKTSTEYLIATRHLNGSKNFATTNAVTNIYWKQAIKVATGTEAIAAVKAEVGASPSATVAFAAGAGWTSY